MIVIVAQVLEIWRKSVFNQLKKGCIENESTKDSTELLVKGNYTANPYYAEGICDTIKVIGGKIECKAGENARVGLGHTTEEMGKCEHIYVGENVKSLYVQNGNAKSVEEIMHANSYSSDTEERTTYFKKVIAGSDMTKVTRYESEGMIFKLNGPDKSISIGLNCE